MDSFPSKNILYQDDWLIAVNKPAGLPVHQNQFLPKDAEYLNKAVGQLTGKSVYNVHRLDAKTSGVMILALSQEAAHALTLLFENKKVINRLMLHASEISFEHPFTLGQITFESPLPDEFSDLFQKMNAPE